MNFEIRFGGNVSIDRSKMRKEFRIEEPKTTRCESNVDTRLGEKIEGGRAKLTC